MENKTLLDIKKAIASFKETREYSGSDIRLIKVLEYRLGLDGSNEMHTLEETGKLFGVTRERIRQMQAKIMEKLRKFDTGLDSKN